MKIRHKITIFIAGTALFGAVGFSGYIFHELLEEPYKLMDSELQSMAESILSQVEESPGQLSVTLESSLLPYSPDLYWIKITDNQNASLYASKLTQFVDFPPGNKPDTYNVEKTIPRHLVQIGQDTDNDVLFRVKTFHRKLPGNVANLVIAKPIEAFEEELHELIRQITAGLVTYTLLVVIISYFLAGRILRPVVEINRLAREISESSLNQRIPSGKNKDELHDLTVSLNRMFDRLQFSFNRQKEFVGNAAHELKSPITLLMLTQEELAQRPQLDENLRSELVRQIDILRRMARLVKNLLDLSRLEQQESLRSQTIDLHKLVGSVLEEYDVMLQTDTIQVDNMLVGPLLMEGDKEKLQRLFINLLDNAWRYNLQKNGVIKITGQKENNMVTLVVSNTGPGVPEEETQRVFEQFYRLEKSRSMVHGGSGLGLTIAKKIVELHGGTINLSSEADGWTKVTVSLPTKS
jgi:signal transduction histidine kinase